MIRDIQESVGTIATTPYDVALLGTIEAVRGRPAEARAAFTRAADVARQMDQSVLELVVRFRHAEAEFFALDEPARAASIVASLLDQPSSLESRRRRLHAQAQNLAAMICFTSEANGDASSLPIGLCERRSPVDSTRDEIEALELMQWDAIEAGRLEDAVRIGNDAALVDAGVMRLHAQLPSAIAFERLDQPDSAAVIYRELLAKTPGTLVNFIPASLVRQSFVARRLVELGGADVTGATERLRHDWADAEPEFVERVVAPLLGS